MTDPEQGGELAAIVATMQAEYEDLNWALKQMEGAEDSTVRNYWATGPVDGKAKAVAWQVRLHWPTIRAALERQAELEAALREYIEWADQLHPDKPFTIEQLLVAIGFAEEFETLLARSAEEVGERG